MSASTDLPEGSYPAYLALAANGELAGRVPKALASLSCCAGCPRGCRVDRINGSRLGLCRTGRLARVVSATVDPDVEDCLRGGLGRIVFAGGPLRCVFGGPAKASQPGQGVETAPQQLAGLMLGLQAAGCRYLNLVNAGHVVPQALEALLMAARGGLRLPLVYSTSAYDGLASLRWLDGLVDVYRPTFKIWDARLALRYLRARNYPLAARRAIREMQRQVGDLRLDEHGLARRGLLLRHPVLPGGAAGTRPLVRWLADEVSSQAAIHVEAQPLPQDNQRPRNGHLPEFGGPASPTEVARARAMAQTAGLRVFV